MTDWNELIDELVGSALICSYPAPDIDNARAALLSAIATVEKERDEYKTLAHGLQDKDIQKQAEIERLRTRLAEAEKDSTSLEHENYFVVCQKCREVLPPQMLAYQYDYCPACGRKIHRARLAEPADMEGYE